MSDGMTEMAREEGLKRQVGGAHYRKYAIQPAEYNARNGLSFLAGNVIKYVTRYKDKGGAEDIRKAMHYLELILEFEYPALLSNNPDAVKPLGAAIAPHTSGLACPITSGSHRDEGELLYATPKLILKLESDDPDTVGECNGKADNQDPQLNTDEELRAAGSAISDRGQVARQECFEQSVRERKPGRKG